MSTITSVTLALEPERGPVDVTIDGGHAPADRPLPGETVQRMVDAGTIASPTLVMMRAVIASRAGQPGPPLSFDACLDSVRAMREAGVPVIAGTDANDTPFAPVPPRHVAARRTRPAVGTGMTTHEALLSATTEAVRHLRLTDRGRIEPGLRADLLLLDTDPLTDLSAARTPAAVWVAGQPVDLT